MRRLSVTLLTGSVLAIALIFSLTIIGQEDEIFETITPTDISNGSIFVTNTPDESDSPEPTTDLTELYNSAFATVAPTLTHTPTTDLTALYNSAFATVAPTATAETTVEAEITAQATQTTIDAEATSVVDGGDDSVIKEAEWTIMVYMAADNNLESFALADFAEMEYVGSVEDEVNIVVQFDRAEGYTDDSGDWTGTRRYYVTSDGSFSTEINSPVVEDLGETNSGDPETLADFGTWAIQTYPAKHYALVIWDHGGSWMGIATDQDSDYDELTMLEIENALKDITQNSGVSTLDIVGFDACMMGGFEVNSTIAPYSNYSIASEELIPGSGWDYTFALLDLTDNPQMDPVTFGESIIDNFFSFYENEDVYDTYSLGMVDLTQITTLGEVLGAFSDVVVDSPDSVQTIAQSRNDTLVYGGFDQPLYADIWSAADLFQFMQLVIDSSDDESLIEKAQNVINVREDVIVYHRSAETLTQSTGMSIFFPRNQLIYNNNAFFDTYLEIVPDGVLEWTGFLQDYYRVAAETIAEWPQSEIQSLESGDGETSRASISIGLDSINVSQVGLVVEVTSGEENVIVDYERLDPEDAENATWDGVVPYLSNGSIDVPLLTITNSSNTNSGVIDGLYTPVNGEPTNAQIVFNLTNGKARSMWGILTTSNGIAPSEIRPVSGDTFEPYWLSLTDENTFSTRLSGVVFTFDDDGIDSLILNLEEAPEDTYAITVVVEDVGGNGTSDEVNVAIADGEVNEATADFGNADDQDEDGIVDVEDNCPAIANDSQLDTDADGQGDACDVDIDNDRVNNVVDDCPLVFGNATANGCRDEDADGVTDVDDNCPLESNPSQLDVDGDGIGDVCDQETGDIQVPTVIIGVPVSGTMNTNGQPDNWRYEAVAGQVISVSVNAEFDSTVTVFDDRGRRIAFNDDYNQSINATIERLHIRASGGYRISVGTFANLRIGGDYTLTVSSLDVIDTNPDAQQIAIGQVMEAIIEDGRSVDYSFDANANDLITLSLDGNFDTTLEVLNSNGERIAFDDDSGRGLTSVIQGLTIPATDTYTVRVGSFNGRGGGAFALSTTYGLVEADDGIGGGVDATTDAIDTLSSGMSISDNLPRAARRDFIYSATAGETLQITARGDFDSTLAVLDTQGNQLAFNDDFGGTRDSQIRGFVVPETANYLVRLGSYNDRGGGNFTLTLNASSTAGFSQQSAISNSLRVGGSVSGELAVEDVVDWTFTGTGGQFVTIETEANFDTTLTLIGTNDEELSFDDDGGQGLNSRISGYELPVDGDYIIRVGSYRGASNGTYTLTIRDVTADRADDNSDIAPRSDNENEVITFADPVTGTLRRGGTEDFVFSGTSGQIINISLTGDFDTTVALLNDRGDRIAFDDDGGDGSNSFISAYLLGETTTYTIRVRSYRDNSGGDYTLSLTMPEADDDPSQTSTTRMITANVEQDGRLTRGESLFYTFEGVSGQSVTISLNGDFDTTLSLFDADDNRLAFDDDGGEGLNSRIATFALPANGSYIVRVGSFNDRGGGRFTLRLNIPRVEENSGANTDNDTNTIVSGQQVEATLPNGAQREWYFTASRDDRVTVDLNGDFDTFLRLLDSGGREIVSDDDGGAGLNSRINNYPIPADGIYTIVVDSFRSRSGGAYTLDLLILDPQAPTPTPTPMPRRDITLGTTVNGNLGINAFNDWSYRGRAGETITIILRAEFPTTLSLYNTSGEVVAVNRGSGVAGTSQINRFTLSTNGTYTIRAASRDGLYTGGYTLSVNDSNTLLPTATPTSSIISPIDMGRLNRANGVRTGNLVAGTRQNWQFSRTPGAQVTFDLVADFDTYLYLYDTTGRLVASDDDGGEGLNSRVMYTVPTTGNYTVQVASFGDRGGGDYSLFVATVNPDAPAPTMTHTPSFTRTPTRVIPTSAPTITPTQVIRNGGTLNVGASITGNLPSGGFIDYAVPVVAGQRLQITLSSNEFDTFLYLFDAGRELARDDDGAGSLNSFIAYTFTANGQVVVRVGSFNNRGGGNFALSIVDTTPPPSLTPSPTAMVTATLPPASTNDVGIGSVVAGSIPVGGVANWSLSGTAGQVVTISLEGDFDTYLRLYNSAGGQIAENDDRGDGTLNSRIQSFTLPANETYRIEVRSFADSYGGNYTLSITAG